ncbi:MAG: asparagine synthase (glutamine-hydrolyzing) [Solirubrobacteraceae bacterium]
MCGIVGVFGRRGRTFDARELGALRDTMIHRGPDDEGLWLREPAGDVGFGHRRLAIVDLSEHGRQPMFNEDRTVAVTFNGEIYNHELLRAELERRGHRFGSRCDAEVLVHLYEEHGAEMVDHLVGMFAFAIWDERRQQLLLARDRLGIKPLYFFDDGETFAFASEIKALLPLVRRREIDPISLAHYLTFVAVPPPRTLFAGVSKLAPAETLLVTRDGPRTPQRYWDPLANRVHLDMDELDWEAELRFRLERSIDRRMMSDVPVGVFLSGGVDSSTNVALMSRLVEHPINTFSIGFRDAERFNEFAWARQIAERFGTNHHEVVIDADDLWRFMPDLVFHQDEPIADPVCVPLYFVAKLAKDNGVTVVHVGEGADELLCGYPTYVQAHEISTGHWRRFRNLPAPLRASAAWAGTRALAGRPGYDIHREALRRGGQPDGRLWWGGAVAFYELGLERVTTPELRRSLDGLAPRQVVESIAADARKAGARSELDELIYQDLRLRLPELLLMRVDKLTMANAVEARVPFLDHEVVELAMAMPDSEKVRDGIGKHVLKRAVSDLLPEDLVWRPKQGFGTPVSDWFRGELGDVLERELEGSEIHELGYLDRDEMREILRLHRSGRAERSFQLWNLLNLSTWFDHWIAKRPAEGQLSGP